MPEFMWIILGCLGAIVGLFYLVLIAAAVKRIFFKD